MVAEPAYTGSGVASAKQTGHRGLNNCGPTATICSESPAAFIPVKLAGDAVLLGLISFRQTCSVYSGILQLGNRPIGESMVTFRPVFLIFCLVFSLQVSDGQS